MAWMSESQRRVLEQLCDTIYPSLAADQADFSAREAAVAEFWRSDARQLGIPQLIERDLERSSGRRRSLLRMVSLLENRALNGGLVGRWQAFSHMTLADRTKLVNAWQNSRLAVFRDGMQTLRRLILFLAYTLDRAGHTEELGPGNPSWPALRYPGRRPPAAGPEPDLPQRRIQPLVADGQEVLDADVLIIGSGAGGGVVAAELASAGLDVLVVDKGGFYDERNFPDTEQAGNFQLYERRGAFPTADGNLLLVAGSNVGGGTTVNWMTSLETPDIVRREWTRDYGIEAATDGRLQAALEAVSRRLGVTTDESPATGSNRLLEQGCRRLGYRVEPIPRNVRDCGQCDFCMFGCRRGAKQDVRRTYLSDAFAGGARILPNAEAGRVRLERGAAVGAELVTRDAEGKRRTLGVRCRAVVAAAGAIQTPALLLRSGIRHRLLGRNLHLHPATAVFAWYPEPVFPWQGPPQSRVCDEFANLDGRGFGARLETCPAHPGTASLATPWTSGAEHKRLMRQLPHTGNVLVLSRDRDAGRVSLDAAGRARVHYRLSPYDARHLLRGTVEALRIQRAAGAARLFSPHAPSLMHEESAAGGDAAWQSYLQRVQRRGIRPRDFALYSAHQLSSCRMASDPARGVVTPAGRIHTLRGLYVADGSLLPTACGVNPMLTIMALARLVAHQVQSDLRG